MADSLATIIEPVSVNEICAEPNLPLGIKNGARETAAIAREGLITVAMVSREKDNPIQLFLNNHQPVEFLSGSSLELNRRDPLKKANIVNYEHRMK